MSAHDTRFSGFLLLIVTHCQIDVQLEQHMLMFGLILSILKLTCLKDIDCFPVSAITNYISSVQSPILH